MAQSEVPLWPEMPKEMRAFLDGLRKRFNTITTTGIGAAGTTQTDWISGSISVPANQDYRIIEKIPEIVDLISFSAKTSSGSVTAALKINSTPVTGGSITATSTQQSTTPSAAKTTAADDALVLTCSSVSAARDLSFIIVFSRTLVN